MFNKIVVSPFAFLGGPGRADAIVGGDVGIGGIRAIFFGALAADAVQERFQRFELAHFAQFDLWSNKL